MNVLCIFSIGRKYRVFLGMALLFSCTLYSQIYVKGEITFTVSPNTIIYYDSIVVSTPKPEKEKAVIYVENGTVITGFQQFTNVSTPYIATKKSVNNEKQKNTENSLAKTKQKPVKKQIIPQERKQINYNLLNSDKYLGLMLGQKMITTATGSASIQKHNASVFYSKNITNLYFFSLYLSEQNYDNIREVLSYDLLNSFRTRPPPFSVYK